MLKWNGIEPHARKERMRLARGPVTVEFRLHQRVDGIIEREWRPARPRNAARDVEVKAARALGEELDLGPAQLAALQ